MPKFEVEFAEHSVFDGNSYAQYLINQGNCEKRQIDPTVQNDQKLWKLEQHRLTVLSSTTKTEFTVTISNETPVEFVLSANDTFVIPACDWWIVVKSDKNSTLSVLSILETLECHRFMRSSFRLYWPIVGTKKYFESIYENVWIHDVYEHTDFFDKFVFSKYFQNDAPIFKFLRRHLYFDTIKYNPLPLYIELSKWRTLPQNISIDDNTKSDVKVISYSLDEETILQLNQDKEFAECLLFPFDSDIINLTSPKSIEFHVANQKWETCRNLLKTNYPKLLHHCVITPKGNSLLESQQIEISAHIHTKEVKFALKQFQENNLVYPILCENDEVPKEYSWSRKVWDLLFLNTSGHEHIKI
jgi:hypothetical protein